MAGNRHVLELGSLRATTRMSALRELDAAASASVLAAVDRFGAFADPLPLMARVTSRLDNGLGTQMLVAPQSSAFAFVQAFSAQPADVALAPISQPGMFDLGASLGLGAAFAAAAPVMKGDAVPSDADVASAWLAGYAATDLDETVSQSAPAAANDTQSARPDGSVETPQANETFTVTQTTVLAPGGDTDGDGVIDPGETVLTTVTITNNSTDTTATGVTFTETLVGMSLTGLVNVSPIAVNDVFNAVGNTQLLVGGASGLSGISATLSGSLLDNDFNVLGDGVANFVVSSVGAFATSGGGTVTINADGSFAYNPAAGFSGADTFTYTIRDAGLNGIAGDADDLSSTATATINITAANTVWYVDAAYDGSNGASNGTSARPFTSLAQVNGAGGAGDVDGANQTIYVRGNHTADFVLESGQSLIGNGTALVVGGYTLTTAGANNTLSHGTGTGVLLNTNNTLSGFNVVGTNAAGTGIADNNGTVGTLTVTNVNVTGSGQAIDIDQGGTLAAVFGQVSSTGSASNGVHLQGVSGTFSATSGQIETSTGVGFLIGASGGGTASSGGAATISYGGNLLNNGGASVEIQDRTGGTVTFTGTITEGAGQGIVADGNAGTVNFTGQIFINSGNTTAINLTNNSGTFNFTPGGNGLDITTTTGNGFIVQGGGTVTLTGAGNTVQTASGRAVEIDGSTIGGAGVTFLSVGVSAGDSTTGIYLRDAGSGGFTITGTGSTAASGGTLNNISGGANSDTESGIGIYIQNTNNISLSNMSFTGGFANFGIRGVNVNNFTLRDSTMNGAFGNSNAADEGAVSFTQLTGTALFEGNSLSGGHEDILVIDNSSGVLNLTVRDSANDQAIIGLNSTAAGNDGILVNTSGTASVTALIEGVNFSGARGDMIQFNASGTATQNITIRNNTMHNQHPDVVSGGGGVSITGGAGTGAGYNVTYRIEGNSMRGAEGTMLFINHLGDAGTVSGSIINNTIGNNNGVFSAVQADTGSNNGGNGIFIGLEHGTGAGNLTHAVLIQGNNIGDIRDGAGIFLRANGDGVAGNGTTRLEATIRNNIIDEMGTNSLAGIYAQVGGAGANDDGLMGLNIENNVINLTGANNSIAALVFDDLSGNGQFYFPGFGGAYDDATLRSFLIGPEGNTLTHPSGTAAHVITSPTGTFATGNAFVLTVPPAAAHLVTKEDWEAALRIRQQQALDDHLGALLADEQTLVALAEALAARATQTGNNNGTISPIPPSPQAGETISVGPFNLPNGQSVTIQWRATIDAQTNGLIVNPVNSGTVTATNVAGFPDTITNTVTTTLDTLTLGGTVWNDNGAGGGTRANGVRDGSEAGIDGLTVALFADANNDDIADTPGTALATTTTAGGGVYSFTGLAPGNYIVRVTPGALISSPGIVDPDVNNANDDNGGPVTGGFVFSNAITLAYNTEPTAGTGNDTNNTLGFALVAPDAEPTLTATALNPTVIENGASMPLFSGAVASTVEPGQTFTSMTLTVTNVTDGADERLLIGGTNVALTDGNSVVTAVLSLTVTVSLVGTTATVTFSGASLDATALQNLVNNLAYRNFSENPTDANRVVTITQLVDSGSNVAPNDNTATLSLASTADVQPVNDAPDLVAISDTVTYTEGDPPVLLDTGSPAAVSDIDSPDFNGGNLTASITANEVTAEDVLGLSTAGSVSLSAGMTIGSIVSVGGVAIGTITSNGIGGADLVITFNSANATQARVAAVAQALTYANTNTANPLAAARSVSITVNDGDGGTSPVRIATVNVGAVNDAPVNTVPGAQNGTEDTNLVFSTGNGNAISVADPDATSLTVTLSVANGTLTLSGIAGISFSAGANGSATMTISGTAAAINAALNGLTYRGNLNYNGPDSLSIVTTDNGSSGTGGTLTDSDSVAITLAPDNIINGDAGNNTLNGTPGADYFDLRQGGDDTVSGGAGNDGFYFGGAYTSADTVDGGAGSLDQIGLQGNYAGGVTLGSIAGVEMIVLLSGADARFGDTANNRYDYNITSPDSAVVAGQRLIIQANTLLAGEDLTFDGSAETDGSFLIYGGLGVDTLTGGAGNDGFFFGQGRFGASDVVNGGGGNMDQLGLQGNYVGPNALTFGANQLTGIEFIVLLSASDNRFGSSGGTVSYSLTMNDGNVAAGQTMTISATTLRSGEYLSFNGSAETNGRFEIYSGDGNDVITGGAGDDLIFGGGRGDTLTGGGGNDIFAYRLLTDSNSTERDGIQDFNLGDRIDLSRIDANLNLAGKQDFTFVGTNAFSGTAGELRYSNVSLGGPIWLVEADANGDGISDLEIIVVITDGHTLTVNDFIGVNPPPAPQEPLKLGIEAGPGLWESPDIVPIMHDFADPDVLQLDLGGAGVAGGHLDMAFARDTGGPAYAKLIDGDAPEMADGQMMQAPEPLPDLLFDPVHDVVATVPTHDFML